MTWLTVLGQSPGLSHNTCCNKSYGPCDVPNTEGAKGTGRRHLPVGLCQFSSVFTFLLLGMKKHPLVIGTSERSFLFYERVVVVEPDFVICRC